MEIICFTGKDGNYYTVIWESAAVCELPNSLWHVFEGKIAEDIYLASFFQDKELLAGLATAAVMSDNHECHISV